MIDVKFKRLHDLATIPTYSTDGSIGLDLTAIEDGRLDSMQYMEFKTGIALELPEGFEAEVRPRSSIREYNLVMSNSPGTIDTDYRGEIIVTFIPGGKIKGGYYKKGDKIAQLVISEKPRVNLIEVTELNETDRGEGGHGSTGT